MLKIPIGMLLSVVIFAICAGIMLLIFSSPKCESLANTTAYNLKVAIDEVSSSNFNTWSSSGEVPSDGDVDYYRTVPIRLCQDKGISYLETILGTTLEPQYKIYYERFPEGGGGTWTEAYPWSGGAAASLRIWAYMRAATFAAKFVSAISSATIFAEGAKYSGFMDMLGGLGHSIRLAVFGPGMEEEGDRVANILLDELGEDGAKQMADTSAYWIIKQIKGEEYLFTVDEAMSYGIIDGVDDSGKIVISNTPVEVMIPDPASYVNGEPTSFVPMYAKYDSAGHILDMTTDSSVLGQPGWDNLKVNPSEMYNDYLASLSEKDQEIMNQIYTTESDIPFLHYISRKITGTEFYQNYLQPLEDKLDSFVQTIGDAGYSIDRTVVPPGSSPGVKLAFIDAFYDLDTVTLEDGTLAYKGDLFADEFLAQPGVKDKIRLALGLASDEVVTKEQLVKALQDIDFEGMVFLPDDLEYGVHQAAINKIVSLSKTGGSYTGPDAVKALFRDAMGYDLDTGAIVDADSYKIIQSIAKSEGITETAARTQAYAFINYDVWDAYEGNLARGSDATRLTENVMTNYLAGTSGTTGLIERLGNGEQSADEQVGLLVGTLEQNKGEMPMTPVGYSKKYVGAEVKKIIYLDGPQNIINPDSFWARALFANLAGAGCQGNSICLYSGGAAAESPIYLNETAKNYFIRVWRPVGTLEHIAGWQAALKQVPENPRFYVVSPCLATAKIWKTTYNNQPTIFVYPEKIDLGDNASNYCYADSGLINKYTEIWLGSDTATLLTTVVPFLDLPEAASDIVGKIVGIGDPVTLAQGMLEGAISWPGWPFKPLTWDVMAANSNKIGLTQIEKGQTK